MPSPRAQSLVVSVFIGAGWLGCGSTPLPIDAGAQVHDLSVAAVDDLAAPDDLAVPDLAPAPPDLTVIDLAGDDLAVKLACGEPEMQCCVSPGHPPSCDPATSTCNAFGVCESCGLYPLDCCPGDTCQNQQQCLTFQGQSFCYPCGIKGQPCCFVGAGCRDGSSCVTPDGFAPVCE